MQLSLHFTLEEFTRSDAAARIGDSNQPTAEHLEHLKVTAAGMEVIRQLLGGHTIHVSSGYRNPRVNASVGGVSNSDHALGYACDFECPDFGNPYQIAKALAGNPALHYDQLIHERKPNGSWWVHASFNPRMRRQALTFNGTHYTPGISQVSF